MGKRCVGRLAQHNGAQIKERDCNARLSISTAWEETRDILAREGRLLSTVALALIVAADGGECVRQSTGGRRANDAAMDGGPGAGRLSDRAGRAAGPDPPRAWTFGDGRSSDRARGAAPADLSRGRADDRVRAVDCPDRDRPGAGRDGRTRATPDDAGNDPASLVAALLFIAIFVFLFVRLVMASPIASAEAIGPVAILRRSWRLTEGHWWPLFGFLLVFFIGAGIVAVAIGSAAGTTRRLPPRQDRADVGLGARAGTDRRGRQRGDHRRCSR